MNFDLLKHPAVSVIISILAAVVVALAAAAGFGVFTPDKKGDGTYRASIVGIPSEAKLATPQQFEDIVTSQWVPEPSFDNKPIGFERDYNEYGLTGKVCNGFGILLVPDFERGTFTSVAGPQTEMWCGQRAADYEGEIGRAFERADGFYVENDDTIYVGKNGKGVRFTRAGASHDARKATPEEVDQILRKRWITDGAPKGSVMSFDAIGDATYVVEGSLCNGFGVALKVNRATATYTVEDLPVTKMGCAPALHAYDAKINAAFKSGNAFYVDGQNVYIGANGTGLKLTPARK